MLLSVIEPHPSPKPSLEQYTIPVDVAATTLWIAAHVYEDIVGKAVLDLGCGSGRLALGAAFLGAGKVVGVDIDRTSIETALKNSEKTGLNGKVQWVTADIDAIHGKFDTVLQNPPFGTQKRQADRRFLRKALEVGKRVYSLHKSPHKDKKLIERLGNKGTNTVRVPPSPFIERFVSSLNGEAESAYAMLMTIPHMFNFHRRERHLFIAELHVIQRTEEA